MAARPDTARKVLLYWMDGLIAFLALLYLTLTYLYWRHGVIPLPQFAAAVAFQLGFYALFPFLLRETYDRPRPPSPKLLAAGACVLGALALLPHRELDGTPTWMEVGVLWLSAAALYLSARATAVLGVALIGLVTGWVSFLTGRFWAGVLLTETLSAAGLIFAMLSWRWLYRTIRDAHDGKEAKARLAVAEERLRFARDLHDLLGHSLSVISLKSELAAKLSTKDAARAEAEMAQVRHLSAAALSEVQVAVDGYRTLDLDDELAGVRAALEAAGTRCVVEIRADELSPAARTLLAWAVREGATNVLKHSTATRCAITIDGGVLEMRNDGVRESGSGPGNGLRGLSERLVTAGGSFSAGATNTGEFLLRAAVPA
ncbi:two-component system, NarL family, sensor histidine kinase DesK [Nonomuraea maritima]|uniref:Two-component system, NarL family, sensor histidine kinase DesK n=1 Tax=Nonomuraea maritima TaxID=683260 RepID=A0A1G9FKV1_9ACTN|nr:histidine kinase [Nonomuraea maritima]SDK88975.1 two-component system, NarL family, sensor histidine kinase DesK [Nonomuraea maritima]